VSRNITLIVALVLIGTSVGCAQTPDGSQRFAPSPPTAPDEVADMALAVDRLREMAAFLADRDRLSATAEVSFSVVQEDGQKIEFGGSRRIWIRRPDRARIENRARDGVTRFLYFDHGKLSAAVPEQKIYATTDVPTQVGEAIDFVIHELEIPVPLAELLHPGFLSAGIDRISSGFMVGEEILEGVRCDHLAFRGEGADVQIWIARGSAPLPRRLVISYRDEPGAPEFRAHFKRWDVDPDVPDEMFIFSPPPSATQVSFDELLDRVPHSPGGSDD
jgi:hypothetical protein